MPNTIVEREQLNSVTVRMKIDAPRIARKAQAGQFVILRTHEMGERIPLTVADTDSIRGTVSIIFQTVGATTLRLSQMQVGDTLCDFAGPLGRPTRTEGYSRVMVVAGGVGCAIAYPITQKLKQQGASVDVIAGFRNREAVILSDEFNACADRYIPMSDDGSWGTKGLVTEALKRCLDNDAGYDAVITIGPLLMMKYVSLTTKPYGIHTIASMNPIMIDGTGMCGGCRLTVGGKMRFACVDGPEFDAHEIDFDEAIARSSSFAAFEANTREATCRLFEGSDV